MAFVIRKGRVLSDILEIKALDQCNLSCRSCDELSPVSANFTHPVSQVQESLQILSPIYHAKTARILGGEPLLRKDILDFVNCIRDSKISDSVRIVTNGTYLDRFSSGLLQALDSVEISIYPGFEIPLPVLREFKDRCANHDVALFVKATPFFRDSYSELGTEDSLLTQRIFKTCKIAKVWGCQSLYNGYFFKCSTAPNLDRLIAKRNDYPSGFKLGPRENFFQDFIEYLESSVPLPACKFCLGTVGRKTEHRQVSRNEWRATQAFPTEQLLDVKFLEDSENGLDEHWDCANYEFAEFQSGIGFDGNLPFGVFQEG